MPERNVFLCIGPLAAKLEFLESAKALISMGLHLYCSQGTYDFYTSRGLQVLQRAFSRSSRCVVMRCMFVRQACSLLHKPSTEVQPNVNDAIAKGEVDLVINVRDSRADPGSLTDGYLMRRKAVDFSVCLLTDVKLATLLVSAMHRRHTGKAPAFRAWDEL